MHLDPSVAIVFASLFGVEGVMLSGGLGAKASPQAVHKGLQSAVEAMSFAKEVAALGFSALLKELRTQGCRAHWKPCFV